MTNPKILDQIQCQIQLFKNDEINHKVVRLAWPADMTSKENFSQCLAVYQYHKV